MRTFVVAIAALAVGCIQACLDLQQILLGTSLWLEGCRLKLDLESSQEPVLEQHLAGMEQAIQSIRLVRV